LRRQTAQVAVKNYQRRVVDDELDELSTRLPAISIDGPKGVGKTATAVERATTVFALDNPAAFELVQADPGRLARAPGPVVIDEWQRFPDSWDLVRRAVDKTPEPGRFLLTSSASPQSPATHSGAGRIVAIRMRPLTLAERGVDTPSVSLASLLRGGRSALTRHTSVGLADYAEAIVRGGFPGMRANTPRAQRALLGCYVDRVVDRDFPEAGLAARNPMLLRRWLAAYAAAMGTTASYESIRDAATAGHANKPAKTTTMAYQDTLQRIWISDPVPALAPTRNHLKRLTLAPKHHLADPALAVALTGVTLDDLLAGRAPEQAIPRDGIFLGALFESLVALSLRVFAQAAEASVHHPRTKGGEREIDFVVSGPDRKIVAVEVTLARTVNDHDLRHLRWLGDALGAELADAVVITTGPTPTAAQMASQSFQPPCWDRDPAATWPDRRLYIPGVMTPREVT
jgi:predicted AAA+ superfamily ATPase